MEGIGWKIVTPSWVVARERATRGRHGSRRSVETVVRVTAVATGVPIGAGGIMPVGERFSKADQIARSTQAALWPIEVRFTLIAVG